MARTPDLGKELATLIRLVRRDMGSLLFHFTRAAKRSPASDVLKSILRDGAVRGTRTWTEGGLDDCVCFTEAPIAEFAAIFSLVEIAASGVQPPRYEPYGIAVTKDWLFREGGRPVIYESDSAFTSYNDAQRYRLVPFDLQAGIDFTWEREWRIKRSQLKLDPNNTLVVVPTAKEAFELMKGSIPEPEGEGTTGGAAYEFRDQFGIPKWMAVSLDLFGARVKGKAGA